MQSARTITLSHIILELLLFLYLPQLLPGCSEHTSENIKDTLCKERNVEPKNYNLLAGCFWDNFLRLFFSFFSAYTEHIMKFHRFIEGSVRKNRAKEP